MDAGETAQYAQMRDEEGDVLYVTSLALHLDTNNHLLIHSPVDLSRLPYLV